MIGFVGTTNLTIISMHGDLENVNHLLNGVILLSIGVISSMATEKRQLRSA